MKLKNKISIFSAVIRLLLLIIMWFTLSFVIKKVAYKKIENSMVEKRDKFVKNLNTSEINAFIERNDSTELYISFSNLHSEFLQLYRSNNAVRSKDYFVDETRIVENESNEYRVLYHHFTYKNTNYVLEIGERLSEVNELLDKFHLVILLLLTATLIVSHFAQSIFIDYLLKPFQKIIDTKINLINEPELFDLSKVHTTTSDFIVLDDGLNQMMDRIQEQFKKEKQFIANVSHELLTPVSVLQNRLENLLNNESINDEGVDKIVVSLRNLDTLKRIINNLLLISRIENHQYSNFEPIDFQSLISELLADLEDRIEMKQLRVSNTVKEHFVFEGNKTLMHILIYNIVFNAIKFTPNGGSVSVSDSFEEGLYSISISDTGKGMTETQLSQIFNRFMKINLEDEGQGLGLSIVSSIANLHKIAIKVSSELNVGTTFSLIFQEVKK
ncbi:sensor histidine kinase [Flavobacterium lindanitolerans]|uniref:histidine kinase n=1 Tax=Flavobacterium lindanitolerans TaxID=428988 RepID=A0A497UU72_9FLAO|nr:HAMP domain-containing sensor histidine kinase [Flavobacterium lindanitolerans]PKW21158.1 signal transduction histidine kinase [Flavobacterium lindanitolerans]RLJ30204.1 signal transduction histidine kinase [Flavobacterium lindanitolerans]